MSLEHQKQLTSTNELRNEHKRLVLEQERLEEQARKPQYEIKQAKPCKHNQSSSDT
jgi:hypothetical protein